MIIDPNNLNQDFITPEIGENNLGLKIKSNAYKSGDFVNNNPMAEAVQMSPVLHIYSEPEQQQQIRFEEKIEIPALKSTNKIIEFIKFILVTSFIFVITFLALNWSAYNQIFTSVFNPSAEAETKSELEKIAGDKDAVQDLIPIYKEKKEVTKSFPKIDLAVTPPDNRVLIPKIAKNIPLVEMGDENLRGENWDDLEKQIQAGLRGGVVHYPGTAVPGQIGNVFITGHSSYYPWDDGKFKDVFALLGKLEKDDVFYIYYNQKKYSYKVSEKYEVQPDNVSVLEQPNDKKIVTLMTCVPVGTALRRLIIEAEQTS